MIFQNAKALFVYAQSSDIRLDVRNGRLLIDAQEGVLSPHFKQCLAQHKQALIFLLSHYGLSREEIKNVAGEDWNDIKDDTKAIYALADAIYKQKLMKKGQVPPTYTSSTLCANCGLVPVPPERRKNGHVLLCPWCWNRLEGLPIPKYKTGA